MPAGDLGDGVEGVERSISAYVDSQAHDYAAWQGRLALYRALVARLKQLSPRDMSVLPMAEDTVRYPRERR